MSALSSGHMLTINWSETRNNEQGSSGFISGVYNWVEIISRSVAVVYFMVGSAYSTLVNISFIVTSADEMVACTCADFYITSELTDAILVMKVVWYCATNRSAEDTWLLLTKILDVVTLLCLLMEDSNKYTISVAFVTLKRTLFKVLNTLEVKVFIVYMLYMRVLYRASSAIVSHLCRASSVMVFNSWLVHSSWGSPLVEPNKWVGLNPSEVLSPGDLGISPRGISESKRRWVMNETRRSIESGSVRVGMMEIAKGTFRRNHPTEAFVWTP